ncbi:MAG TPA: hypothetical protein VMS77_04110 [Conexivisphaerales archaeon]|nr:hypothetical protein [Conexivisphaerales archaeon]
MARHFSSAVASAAAGLFLLSALLSLTPAGGGYETDAAECALMLSVLSVGLGGSKVERVFRLSYASAWAFVSLVGFASPFVLLPALAVLLDSLEGLSYRAGRSVQRLLNAFLALPPGRGAAKRSMFAEAYASNLLLLAAGCLVATSLLTGQLIILMASAVLLVASIYFAVFRDDSARTFESELPFLMILASFYSSAGHRGIEAALESMTSATAKVFKGLGLARLTFLRERLFSSPAPAKTLGRFASRQKDAALSEIIDGYVTVAATGGDANAYLMEQTDRSLSRFEETRLGRVRATRGIAEVLLLTLALAPSVALTISVIGLNGSYTLYALAVSLPVASLVALTLVDLYLPPVKDLVTVNWGLPLGLAAAAAVVLLSEPLSSVPLSLTAGAVALLVPLSVEYQVGANAARRDERECLKMMTSLVESLRVGKSVHEALDEASRGGLSPSFTRLMRDFTGQIGLGLPPPEAGARVDSRSWVARASFVIMGHAMVLGGGLEIVERFRSFLTKYVDSWAAVRREALWTAALSASLPFVTLGGVSVITNLQAGFVSDAQQPAMALALQALPLQSVLLAFVEVSALAAVISSKLAGLTIKATPVALATMAATLVSLVVYGLA